MKLKDFLKEFEGLDPELEVGILDYSHFISEIFVEKTKVEPGKYNPVISHNNHGEEVILISS